MLAINSRPWLTSHCKDNKVWLGSTFNFPGRSGPHTKSLHSFGSSQTARRTTLSCIFQCGLWWVSCVTVTFSDTSRNTMPEGYEDENYRQIVLKDLRAYITCHKQPMQGMSSCNLTPVSWLICARQSRYSPSWLGYWNQKEAIFNMFSWHLAVFSRQGASFINSTHLLGWGTSQGSQIRVMQISTEQRDSKWRHFSCNTREAVCNWMRTCEYTYLDLSARLEQFHSTCWLFTGAWKAIWLASHWGSTKRSPRTL